MCAYFHCMLYCLDCSIQLVGADNFDINWTDQFFWKTDERDTLKAFDKLSKQERKLENNFIADISLGICNQNYSLKNIYIVKTIGSSYWMIKSRMDHHTCSIQRAKCKFIVLCLVSSNSFWSKISSISIIKHI